MLLETEEEYELEEDAGGEGRVGGAVEQRADNDRDKEGKRCSSGLMTFGEGERLRFVSCCTEATQVGRSCMSSPMIQTPVLCLPRLGLRLATYHS